MVDGPVLTSTGPLSVRRRPFADAAFLRINRRARRVVLLVKRMSSRASASAWPLWVALVLLFGCVAAAVRAAMSATDGRFVYALDDAYIHMAMAKNLARHGVWGCTPFQFSAASSSPLWTALLGVVFFVTGVHDVSPLLLNLLLLALTLGAADVFLRRRGAAPLLRAATLVGLVLVFPMPAMALFGMEHVLHLLLTIAFGAAAVTALADTGPHAASFETSAALCGLAALLVASRYEGLFLVGVVCLLCLACGQWRRGVAIGIAALVPVAVVGAVSIAHGSLFLPNSLMLKAGGDSASTWTAIFKPIGGADIVFLQRHPALLWLVVGGLALATLEFARTRRGRSLTVLMPLVVAVIVALHVHFALSSEFWVYRYDAYLLGFGVFAVGMTLAGPGQWPSRPPPWLRGALPAMAVAGCVFAMTDVRAGLYPAQEIASASLTYREHYEAARFVREWHAGETVLVNDLGAMSYFANARTLDIFGLCDIEPVRLRRAGAYTPEAVAAWTAPHAPTIAVVQLSWGWVAQHIPTVWQKVAEVDVLPDGRTLGFFTTTTDASAARRLRAEVDHFYGATAGERGYRVHLF